MTERTNIQERFANALEELRKPYKPDDIRFRVYTSFQTRDGRNLGQISPHVPWHVMMARLREAMRDLPYGIIFGEPKVVKDDYVTVVQVEARFFLGERPVFNAFGTAQVNYRRSKSGDNIYSDLADAIKKAQSNALRALLTIMGANDHMEHISKALNLRKQWFELDERKRLISEPVIPRELFDCSDEEYNAYRARVKGQGERHQGQSRTHGAPKRAPQQPVQEPSDLPEPDEEFVF